ncbi:MAG: TIR domain-containing protein [Flavobacteriales bacterium]|nr:TIR domain-containing protein [Flavobacteriales bacterium]
MKVFISHSSTDKKFVRTLKDDLTENSIETWFDEDELNLGDSLAEKLELALEESSHFLIILSPTSVNSEWVRFELEKALIQNNSQLLQKIIPVKYSACEVPKELASLLYEDLSNDVRRIQGDKVEFVSGRYSNFLLRLCKSIRSAEKALSTKDRSVLRKGISKEIARELEVSKHHVIKSTYTLIGYKDVLVKKNYAKMVLAKTKHKELDMVKKIRPVLLPPLLKNVFPNIKLGDKLYFSKNYFFNEFGHFAGFRKDDLAITLDPIIRNGISVTKGKKYNVEIDTETNRITFLEN